MIYDIGGHEIGIVALEAGAAEHHHGLRYIERNERTLRRFGGVDVGHRRKAGFGRQSAERLIEQFAERGRVDIADHGNLQCVLGQYAADIVPEIGDVDFRHAFQGAIGLPPIGMVAKGDFQELAAGKRCRIGSVAPQTGNHLRAHAFDIGALEMRRRQRHAKQVESLIPVVLEHPQRTAKIVPRRTEAQLNGATVEVLVERLGIQIARAFIDQIRDQIADTGFVGRILGRTAAEGVLHRDQWHGGILHEPGLDASRRNQMLYLCRGVRWRGQRHHRQAGGNDQSNAPRASREIGHERFSSRFGAVSLIR